MKNKYFTFATYLGIITAILIYMQIFFKIYTYDYYLWCLLITIIILVCGILKEETLSQPNKEPNKRTSDVVKVQPINDFSSVENIHRKKYAPKNLEAMRDVCLRSSENEVNTLKEQTADVHTRFKENPYNKKFIQNSFPETKLAIGKYTY